MVAPEETAASAVIIKRGDPVVLRASLGGGTEVRMGGRALGQARVGGILNVENDSSHRIIRGRLAADGTVEVAN
jgi:flagella basal body P-ring formation protein FlgA